MTGKTSVDETITAKIIAAVTPEACFQVRP